jgi:HSP20 family protein
MIMRPYRGWSSPWREMERLRREMNRLFSEQTTPSWWRAGRGYPAINVWTDEDSAVVTAELPGLDLEDIEIAVENDTLTLRGSREPHDVEESATFHRQERRFGNFVRSFRMPFNVDAENVEANYSKGVLNITLPRAEADKPKRITVRAG